MTVRDLGYRAYEGELRAPSQNYWVMMRHGMWRIWGSWVNKLVVFFFWAPLLVFIVLAWMRAQVPETAVPSMTEGPVGWFFAAPPVWMRSLTGIQFWFFGTILTLRSGAGVISGDLNNRAYQFYFAKPVTPAQYLGGRVSALAVYVFGVITVPTIFLALVLMGLGPEEQRLERAGLILPALLDGALIAIVSSTLAIATSALSKSRALTLTAWAMVLFVPFALAFLVQALAESEWMFLTSVPGALWAVGDALYKVDTSWEELRWFHAAPVLVAAVGGTLYAALRKISRAEVIT